MQDTALVHETWRVSFSFASNPVTIYSDSSNYRTLTVDWLAPLKLQLNETRSRILCLANVSSRLSHARVGNLRRKAGRNTSVSTLRVRRTTRSKACLNIVILNGAFDISSSVIPHRGWSLLEMYLAPQYGITKRSNSRNNQRHR